MVVLAVKIFRHIVNFATQDVVKREKLLFNIKRRRRNGSSGALLIYYLHGMEAVCIREDSHQ